MTRSVSRTQELHARGVQSVIADAFDAARLRDAVVEATPEVVINQLTNIPRRLNPRRIEGGDGSNEQAANGGYTNAG